MQINESLPIFALLISKMNMDKEIEKLELHVVRLEQAIRQVQRLRQMGLDNDKIDRKIDEYLDGILEAKKRIEELKKK